MTAAPAPVSGNRSWWERMLGIERKDILPWRASAMSTEDRDNFTTNRVTLAAVNDHLTRRSALGVSATWACVNLIAGTIGSLPVMVYRTVGGVRQEARDHPLFFVLHDSPNRHQSPIDFWEYQSAGVELHGNAFATVERGPSGRVAALNPVRPDTVRVRLTERRRLEYRWTENGVEQVRDERGVLHIRGPMATALGGLSTLRACSSAFDGAMSADGAAETFFRNGVRPSGVLSPPKEVNFTPEQRDQMEQLLDEKFRGAMNAGRPMLLDGGLTWTQLDITPHDAQMLESRRFSGEEICRIFGVPPAMAGFGDKSSNWGTGKEVDVLGFQKFTLRRRLKRIEQALMKQLLSPEDIAEGVVVEFNLEGLLRGDTGARFETYEKGIRIGVLTRNECRRRENLPPVDGGDQVTVQMQDVPLSEAIKRGAGDAA